MCAVFTIAYRWVDGGRELYLPYMYAMYTQAYRWVDVGEGAVSTLHVSDVYPSISMGRWGDGAVSPYISR